MPTQPKIPEIKSMSAKGLNFLVKEEGCILHPYRDTRGIWTIGIGCTYYPSGRRVKATDKHLTMAEAKALFKTILKPYETTIWSVTRDDINQNQFDALCSLCYNIGVSAFKSSTLLKIVNAFPNNEKIPACFEMFRYSNGEPILLARRKRESLLYFS